jgi:hypothetical protein
MIINMNYNLFGRNAVPAYSLPALQYYAEVTKICIQLISVCLQADPSQKFIVILLEFSEIFVGAISSL